VAALGRLGVGAVCAVWDEPRSWTGFDLVVVRTTWDYAERRDQFLAWATGLPRVLNPLPVLEWSTDKRRYLTDLAQAGVPVVATVFFEPGVPFEPPGEPFVVKPAVSAGGRSSARFDGGDEAASELVRRIQREGRVAMVQPFLGGVDEVGLVFIGGSYSHAVRRRVPLPVGAPRPGLYLDEEIGPAEPSPEELEVAERAVAVAPGELLYARVDLLGGAVLELELAEPSLYLASGAGSADRFAAAIAAATARS
jgi:glutathione synthase/RimK-type ligase-like ATP-grasp enzyme